MKAMRACRKHWSRSATIASALAGELARGEYAGREDLSHRSPAARLRPSHFLAVTALMRRARLGSSQATLGDVLDHFQVTKVG